MGDASSGFATPHSFRSSLIWYGCALLACLFVAFLNNGALYYFDTAGYLAQGKSTLASIGISPPQPGGAAAAGAATGQAPDAVVVGNRSAIYSALVTGLFYTVGPWGVVVFHTLALIVTVWLVARICARLFDHGYSVAATTGIPILVAALSALPFYTAYLMPDIFAPILIMIAACFAIFGRDMTLWEIVLALCLGCFAVVVHPSHLLIAALLLPLVAVAALLFSRYRWWLPPLLMGCVLLGGLAERVLFREAVKTVRNAEVVYQPFLTARSIEDGPGLAVLENACPDAELATCALFEALQKSDDPWRLTASHIMFESDPALGSYKLLPQEVQKAVAEEQISFFLRVLKERPFELTAAFIRNTLEQANLFSVQYTIPTASTLVNIHRVTDIAPASFEDARFLGARDKIGWVHVLHTVVYAVSALLVVVIVVLPQKSPPLAVRGFAMVVLCGILINAFVCGGVSQPSDRYGARVAFLLPIAASFIILFYAGVRRQEDDTEQPFN